MRVVKNSYIILYLSDMNDRIAIDLRKVPASLKNVRKQLRKLGHGQMTPGDLLAFINTLETDRKIEDLIGNMLRWISYTFMQQSFTNHSLPVGLRCFLRCIGSESPVTSYLRRGC